MKWLDLTTIKAHLRITENYEDSLLQTYGESAEDLILTYLNRSFGDLLAKYGAVPTPIKHASLLLVETFYKYRAPITVENMNLVPYTFDLMVKPYVRL